MKRLVVTDRAFDQIDVEEAMEVVFEAPRFSGKKEMAKAVDGASVVLKNFAPNPYRGHAIVRSAKSDDVSTCGIFSNGSVNLSVVR